MGTVDDEAKTLAEKHYVIEVGVSDIIQLRPESTSDNGHEKKIGLLEVNLNTVPSGIMPIEFGPAPASGIHYPSVIIEVTPDEFEQIKSKQLPLPLGWSLGDSIPRPTPVDSQ
jgi:hypothetical protein